MSRRQKMRYPLPLGEVARRELAVPGLAERLKEADIWRHWPEVVGSTVAARAFPLRIIKGTLTVAVSSGPWMQELRFLAAMMKDKLNARLECDIVKEIVFKSGRVEQKIDPPDEEPRRKKKLTSRQVSIIDETSAEISDPETRKAFADLMKASLENT